MREIKSIVLVDDDLDDQEIFRTACAVVDEDAEVMGFENPEQAMNILPGMAELPDVIFLDLNMPRLNGLEVLQLLKQNPLLREVPVVIYTTSFDSRVKEKFDRLGVAHILEKPSCFVTLCSKLETLFQTVIH